MSQQESFERRIDDLLDLRNDRHEPVAALLLGRFFDPTTGFAGATFDDLPNNHPASISVEDLLAVSLLDVRVPPRCVRLILYDDHLELADALKGLPGKECTLWGATEEQLAVTRELLSLLIKPRYDGIGTVKAFKLLARKRPNLVPVIDKVIQRRLAGGPRQWRSLSAMWNTVLMIREALESTPRRSRIESLRPSGNTCGILRLLDALAWMRWSESEDAVREQIALGLTPARKLPERRTRRALA